jgi:predicted lipoprotein with Yx(FWY)xxD motif
MLRCARDTPAFIFVETSKAAGDYFSVSTRPS